MKFLLLVVGALAVLANCAPVVSPGSPVPDSPVILFPADGCAVQAGQPLSLMCTDTNASVEWWSTLTGKLGAGPSLTLILPAGQHTIELRVGQKVPDRVSVVVNPLSSQVGTHRRCSWQNSITPLNLTAGTWQPALLSWAEGPVAVQLKVPERAAPSTLPGMGSPHLRRDLPRAFLRPTAQPFTPLVRQLPPSLQTVAVGDQRSFFLVNPAGDGHSGWALEAICHGVHAGWALWVDKADQPADLNELWTLVSHLSLPRAQALWGQPSDVDQNGRVDVVVSGRLNQTGVAVGFFNPADLFPRVTVSSSAEFNPLSNQGEVLYLGLPVAGALDWSVASLAATAAHEYQHLVRFSTHTLAEISRGNDRAPAEETFLDEGLSHLTESLVGLGRSGGNLLFAWSYLQAPWQTSLVGTDASGREDSAAKRGGMALFLWHLFQQAGGGHWSDERPAQFEDGGGLQALRNIGQGGRTGLAGLEAAFEKPVPELLADWMEAVEERMNPVAVANSSGLAFDKITGEPTSLTGFEGPCLPLGFEGAGSLAGACLEGPRPAAVNQMLSLLPWSPVWFDAVEGLVGDPGDLPWVEGPSLQGQGIVTSCRWR